MRDRDLPAFDCYRALGVPVTATEIEIETAFRAAAKREHPDLQADAAEATIRMQHLNVARDWLTDPECRARYDAGRGIGVVMPGGMSRPSRSSSPADLEGATTDGEPTAASGSMAGPMLASVSVMVLLTTIFVGTGTLFTTVLMLASVAGLVAGIALTLLGATR